MIIGAGVGGGTGKTVTTGGVTIEVGTVGAVGEEPEQFASMRKALALAAVATTSFAFDTVAAFARRTVV